MSVEETVPPQARERQATPVKARHAKHADKPKGNREKPKQRGFRPDIQGMRALAVGMVLIYHLWPSRLPGGFAGVDVFFVISGFLITGHLLREYRKTGRIALVEFWGRRAKRLVPAAALVLAVTWVASRFLLPATRLADTAAQILASALYFQNWRLAWNAVDYLKSDSAASPAQHFWSLSVEEQFYLGWPLLFLLAALVALTARETMRRRSRGHMVVLFLAAAVVGGSLLYSVYDTRADPSGAYFVTSTRIWELGVGGLLALLPEGLSRWIGRFGLLGWAGLGLVIASAFTLSGSDPFPGVLALAPVGGAALLILGGSAAGRFGPSRLTSARPMVFIGGISYSLYLWHWPLIVLWEAWSDRRVHLLSGAVLIVASVLLSWLTKVWVEDKVRTASLLSGHSWRSVSTALVAVVPVALATVFILGEPGPWNGHLGPNYPGAAVLASKLVPKAEPVVPPPTAIKLPAYWQQGCLVAEESAAAKECTFGDTTHPALTVALAGDSIAGDWFTPLQQIAKQRHWKLVTELHSVCPLTSTMLVSPAAGGGPYTACHDWGKAVVHDLITRVHPNVVITSDLPGLATIGHPDGGAAAQSQIGGGMNAYWRQLEAHGASVIAIKESPAMGLNVPECVTDNPDSPGKCAVPKAKAIKPDLPTSYATQQAAGKVPLIDMNPLICGRDKCPAIVGNVLVYQDNHHLTSTYALTTTPYLEKRLFGVSETLAKAR